jgi:hypothetical protein
MAEAVEAVRSKRQPDGRWLLDRIHPDRVHFALEGGEGQLFPVVTGKTGADPIFQGAADFDLELVESRTLDGRIQELVYRPSLHV